jgi:F-type H+-transporting ATPase subunit a
MQHQLWITALFNHYLNGLGNGVLDVVGRPAAHHNRPWSDWMVCELLVFAFIVIFFAMMRTRLSVDRPGPIQHTLEVTYEFIYAQAEDAVGELTPRYVVFFGSIFFCVLFLNLLGLIPGFDSPTMYPMVTLGFAVSTFIFYNAAGLRHNGLGYFKQFVGPLVWLAPLLIPIEIFTHFSRMLSLSVRLYANMFAGEQVYITFLALLKIVLPVIFIALHLFVALLQAYIFMLLAMIYVGQAVSHEH